MTPQPPVVFGPFRFDASTGELSKEGRRVTVQSQPARVLAMLVAHAGEVVTRERLRHEIWRDAYVNFDQGLNYCIRQIRIALEDDAREPQYVQTLPQRGYRFIARASRDARGAASTARAWRPLFSRARHLSFAVILVCAGIVAGLLTAAQVIREVAPMSNGHALADHLSPLHIARGAWIHHLRPIIAPGAPRSAS